MPPIPKLDTATSNSYAGDTFTQLIQTYNQHTHPLANSTNFLTYPLTVGLQVSFTGISQANPDPFAGIGNALPLTILEISADAIKVSRAATANLNLTTIATLTYIDSAGDPQQLNNLNVTAGSNLVTFNLIIQARDGLISSSLLNKCLTKYLTTDAAVDQTQTNSLPTLPVPQPLIVSVANSTYAVSTYTGNNPILSLVRGQQYVFTVASTALLSGGFNLVTQVQDPLYGLKLVTAGVTTDNVNHTVTYTVPYDAPSTLFYQSNDSANLYGQINITGGTVLPNSNVWQPVQTTLVIPTSLPHQQTVLLLSANTKYRLTKFEIYPQWLDPSAPKDAYVQLQYLLNSLSFALSPVLRLQSLDVLRASAQLATLIIPAEATVLAALYTPINLKRLSYQLTTVELTDA
jgi:hypothetical protein